jgi:Sulfotransferase domain
VAHPITFLWTVPRSVSTSFERMMTARGDHRVFDEPFSLRYYFSPERRSSRFDETLPRSTAAELIADIETAAQHTPVFVKDMAYQAADLLEPSLLERFRNCFLVRDPAATLRSLEGHWPDFTDEETGWEALGRAADVVEKIGQPLVVVEAARLCEDPKGVVSAWCDAVDLRFVEDALSWEPGMRPEWETWEDWHHSTASSTGFQELDDPPPAPTRDEPRLFQAHEEALPVYERLVAHAITASPPQ